MKLHSVYVDNYGVFRGRNFDFGDGGFCLIHGPNEAGKTTLLQLVRDLLFGFPHRTPYQVHDGRLSAVGRAELADGRSLNFRREKKRTGSVSGEIDSSREPLDEDHLERLLGGASDELFQHVFAFSLHELSSGEKSLAHANLTEALYGGGMGNLAHFQSVRERIQSERDEWFKARGRAQRIHTLLGRIDETSRTLKDAIVRPQEYDELEEQWTRRKDAADRLRGELEQLQKRLSERRRLQQALPVFHRARVIRDALAEFDLPDGFPFEEVDRFERLSTRVADLEQECAGLASELELKDSADAEEESEEPLLAEEPAIRAACEEVGRIRRMLDDVPVRREESRGLRESVGARLREVNAEWTVDDLDRLPSALVQREEVDRLAEEGATLEKRETDLAAREPELRRRAATTRQRLNDLPDTRTLPALTDLLERANEIQSDRRTRADLQRDHARRTAEVQSLDQRLRGPLSLDDDVDLAALPVPLPATVQEFSERLRDCDERLRRAEEQRETAVAEEQRLERSLAEHDGRGAVPGREELERERTRRDELWRALRSRFVEGDDHADWPGWFDTQPADAAGRYEELVHAADEIADERQARSEEVARREQLEADLQRARTRVEQANANVARETAARDDVQEEWTALWSGCGFVPLSPEAMQEWLATFDEWRERRSELEHVQERIQALSERIDRFDTELLRAFPGPEGNVESALVAARQRHEELREAAADRKRLEAELPELDAELRTIDQTTGEVSQRRAEWQSRRRRLAERLGLPPETTVGAMQRILAELSELRRKHDEAAGLDRRVNEMQAEIAGFTDTAKEICERVAPELAERPPVDAIRELHERLERTHQARLKRQTLARAREQTSQRLDAKREELQRVTEERNHLVEAAGLADPREFARLAHVAREHRELSSELADRERELQVLAAGDETLVQRAADADADELAGEIRTLEEEIRDAEQAAREASEAVGAAAERLREVENGEHTSRLQLDLESHRAELGSAVEQWAPLALLDALMERAVQRFEREHQPELLVEISRLLERMTLGRYVSLQRKLDEAGSFVVERSDGTRLTADQLSTGTREQLYLAIRLAFVEHYCQRHEPLPLVMDDVLVNFDERRARQTLDVLLELAARRQVLFMTCHRHVVDLVREAAPGVHTLPLEAGVARAVEQPPVVAAKPESDAPGKRRASKAKVEETGPGQSVLFPDQ